MPRSVASWGLDVGTTSLKAIKLRKEGEGVVVEAFDVVEHDQFLTEPDVNRDEVIRSTLQKFLERNPISRKDSLYIGVPGSTTFARFVKLPPVEPKKIPEIVKFEAIQQIPFPLDQVNWDFKTFTSPDSPDVEVGIFAMKKELVMQVLANFTASDIAVEGVQMNPLAVFNAMVYDGASDGKGTVLLDVGAEHSDLIILDQGRLWLRTVNIGGNNFTDALAKSFKLSFHKAEDLKKNAATSKYARQIYQAMRPIFADLVTEVQRSIGYYNSSHRDSNLERVIGMGTPFKLPNLQKYLQQNLNMEVIRMENFRKATAEGKLAAGLAENILAMPAAYGLALQGLDLVTIDTNLLPIEAARQMVWKVKKPWFAAAAACVVLGVGLQGMRLYMDGSEFNSASGPDSPKARENDTRIVAFNTLNRNYGSIPDNYTDDLAKITNYMNLTSDRAFWPSVYHDLYSNLPQVGMSEAALYADPRTKQNKIMIRTITPDYSYALGSAAAAAGAPAGPMPMMSAPVAAGPVVSRRGFGITLSGYTPSAYGINIVRTYIDKLRRSAPENGGSKPYFFDFSRTPFTYHTNTPTPTGGGGDILWGSVAGGQFSTFFNPAILTKPGDPIPLTTTAVTITSAIDPDTRQLMYGDTIFELKFNVVFKASVEKPAANGP